MAVPLPADAVEAVERIVDAVRGGTPAHGGAPVRGRDVRWVRLDQLHLTLRFLGPTPEERIAPTAEAVRTVAAAAAGPIQLELRGAGAFPTPERPRAIWLGVGEGSGALAELATALGPSLSAAGWPVDDRPFRPHLTLARSDGVPAGAQIVVRLVNAMRDRPIHATLDSLTLFESVTGGGPARYVPVMAAALGETAGEGPSVYHQTTPDPT